MLPSAAAGPVWAALIWISYAALIVVAFWCTAAALRSRSRFGRVVWALVAIVVAITAIRFTLIFAGLIDP